MKAVGATVKWLLIGGGLLVLVLVVAVLFSLGSAANESEKSSKQVSPAKFALVKTGWTKGQLRGLVGKPEDTQVTAVKGLTEECWLYGVLSSSGTYVFCFENGRLASKTRQ